jgi:hypothetical protein
MAPLRRTIISALLLFFAVWDLALAAATVVWPDVWFRFIHGVPRVDPQALLSRTGLVWLAFALFHFIAWRRWQKEPHWLVIVGGMRLAEVFADLGYLLLANDVTPFGRSVLAMAAPTNLLVSAWLIQNYLVLARDVRRRLEVAEARIAELEDKLAEHAVPAPACPPITVPLGKIATPVPAGPGGGS